MSKFLIKRWNVKVKGFDSIVYEAATIGKARAMAWHDYGRAHDCSFKEFLKISRLSRNKEDPPHFGELITVSGEPAFFIGLHGGNSIRFARPDSDYVLVSHKLDAVLWDETTEITDASIPK